MMYLVAICVLGVFVFLLISKRQKPTEKMSDPSSSDEVRREAVLPIEVNKSMPTLLHTHQEDDSVIELVLDESAKKTPEGGGVTTKNQAAKLRQRGDHRGAYKASKFLPPIEKGYQIFLQNMGITGLGYRREEAVAFIDDLNQTLRLEREADNPQDENAIKVIGVGDSREYFLGYLPKFAALQIVQTDSFDAVYGRLVRAYRGTDDYLEIQLQVVGLKEKKKEFDAFAKKLPAQTHQKEYLTYWSIPFNDSLTVGEAESIVFEHSEKVREEGEVWSEFQTYLKLLEDFEDEDNRESFGLAEIPREVLMKTLRELRLELGSYDAIHDEPDVLVEKILENYPELALD